MVVPLESILLGDWQEDHAPGTTRTFVRGDRELGPARYRQRWSFRQDGTLSTRVLAENDAHYFVEGRWRIENSTLILEYRTRAGRVVREALRIVELSQQTLKIGR